MTDRKLAQMRGQNEDENSRSAILSHFPSPQNLAGVSARIERVIEIPEKDHEIKPKGGSLLARIVFNYRVFLPTIR